MEREPDRIGRCFLHAVAFVCRDQETISRSQQDTLGSLLEAQLGLSRQQGNPLVPFLVVPETRGRRMAYRQDPFEREAPPLEQSVEALSVFLCGKMCKQVLRLHHVLPGVQSLLPYSLLMSSCACSARFLRAAPACTLIAGSGVISRSTDRSPRNDGKWRENVIPP